MPSFEKVTVWPLSVSVAAGRRLPPMARPGEFGAEIERYYQQELTP